MLSEWAVTRFNPFWHSIWHLSWLILGFGWSTVSKKERGKLTCSHGSWWWHLLKEDTWRMPSLLDLMRWTEATRKRIGPANIQLLNYATQNFESNLEANFQLLQKFATFSEVANWERPLTTWVAVFWVSCRICVIFQGNPKRLRGYQEMNVKGCIIDLGPLRRK